MVKSNNPNGSPSTADDKIDRINQDVLRQKRQAEYKNRKGNAGGQSERRERDYNGKNERRASGYTDESRAGEQLEGQQGGDNDDGSAGPV